MGRNGLREKRLDALARGRARGSELAPGAVGGGLVLAPAEQLRAVAEAVSLHLVVPDFDDELGAHTGLLEFPRPPAVRLRDLPGGVVDREREHLRRDLRLGPRRDRA